MKSSKAQGVDEVDALTFKRYSEILAPKIANLINSSFNNNRVEPSLKTCRIKPVFKNGDKEDPGNFRPISILPNVDKIMSKIVNDQLMSHLEANNIITPRQYGFRWASNTQAALFDLVTSTQAARDQGRIVVIIFLDMTKAFDTVYRKILLQEMNSIGVMAILIHGSRNIYGIEPNILKWRVIKVPWN